MNKTTKYLLTSICIGAIQFSNAAMAQSMMSKDSTSLMPSGMINIIPHVNSSVAPTYYAPGRINNSGAAYCGASANSILPDVPNSFLCSSGNASNVTTVGSKYLWTCTGVTGLVSSCSADDRIVGTCGSDNGKSLSTQPTNLCSQGSASSVNLSGSTYNWTCDGNYGPRASCSATYTPPPPPPPSPSGITAIAMNSSGQILYSAGNTLYYPNGYKITAP